MHKTLIVFTAALLLTPPASPAETSEPDGWLEVRRVLEQCTGVYTALPNDVITHSYTGGPILGNGEIGATLGGMPESQTIHLNRLDNWGQALGGLSITAPVGQDPAQYRYEQDIEKAEVRAQVTIHGNPTEMTSWVAPNEPLLVLKLTNRSTQPVPYTVSPWTKGEKNGAVAFFSYGITSADMQTVAVYDQGSFVALGPDDSDRRCWIIEHHGDLCHIRNVQTGNYMVGEQENHKILCQAVDPKAVPGAQWNFVARHPFGEYRNVLTQEVMIGDVRNRAVKLGPSSPQSRASVWGFNPVNRPFAPVNAARAEGVSWAWRERTGKFTARAVIACRILDARPEFRGSLQTITLDPGATATVVVAVDGQGGLDSQMQDLEFYRRRAVDRVNRQTMDSVAALDGERLRWWRSFWLTSHVDLGDRLLNQYWHGAFYALACCSRAGNPCPGLWGAWITTDVPGWGGNYYCNYNFQAPFYGVFSGNHPALADPFFETALGALPFFAPETQAAGYRGVVVRRSWGMLGTMGAPPPQRAPAADKRRNLVPNDQLDSTMFNAMNFLDRYETTLDRGFLDHKLYPMLRACVDFFDDYLVLEPVPGDSGKSRYVLPASGAREGTATDLNALYPLGFLRRVYRAALDASRELNRDAERRVKWQDILARLSDYSTAVVNGKRVFKECENSERITLRGPGDNCSLLQFIYPGNQLGLDSPSQALETARNTLHYLNSGKTPSWNNGNNFAFLFSCAVRIGADEAALYQALRARIEQMMRPNLTVYQRGGGIETSAATEAIDSMLLQSHEGVLRFFPAWPKDHDAAFVRLRAHGAFVVSAKLTKGAVSGVNIASEKGRGCTIVNPWPGRKVRLVRHGEEAETLTGARFTLKTAPGETIELRPE